MRLNIHQLFVFLTFLTLFLCVKAEILRDKRTIDVIIRSLADTFGYDVQKRPPLQAPVTKAPPPPKSTFFPPPLRPLTTRKPIPATPAKPLAALPRKNNVNPKNNVNSKNNVNPSTAAPLQGQFRKTFNVAFNFNRNVNTIPPPTQKPSPAPPARAPAPSAPPPRPLRPPAPPPPLPPLPPLPPPPPTKKPLPKPPMTTTQRPSTSPKAQLYRDDYSDDVNIINEDEYQNLEAEPVVYDYHDFDQRQEDGHQNYEDSKERFRQSLDDFWRVSPHRHHDGYKFLSQDEQPQEQIARNRYEEYDLEDERQPQGKYILYRYDNDDNDDEAETQQKPIKLQQQTSNKRNNKYKKATKNRKNEFKRKPDEIVDPQFSGILHVPLKELYNVEKRSNPWPNPFDIDNAESQIVKEKKESEPKFEHIYVPDEYVPEENYEPPPQQKYNYAKYEKLHRDGSGDTLSANAKVFNVQYGQKIVHLNAKNDSRNY